VGWALGRVKIGGWWLPLAGQVALAAGLGGYLFAWERAWAQSFNVIVAWAPTEPAWRDPAWDMIEALPPDAVPIVPNRLSLAVSARARSYTARESLLDKSDAGMGAGTHAIVHRLDEPVLDWAMAMPGARAIADNEDWRLITWDAGAADPSLPRDAPRRIEMPRSGEYSNRFAIPGVAPREPEMAPHRPRGNVQPPPGGHAAPR
jgi:hypothetical protein